MQQNRQKEAANADTSTLRTSLNTTKITANMATDHLFISTSYQTTLIVPWLDFYASVNVKRLIYYFKIMSLWNKLWRRGEIHLLIFVIVEIVSLSWVELSTNSEAVSCSKLHKNHYFTLWILRQKYDNP